MHHIIKGKNNAPVLKVELTEGESVSIAKGCLIATMNSNAEDAVSETILTPATEGGLLRSIASKFTKPAYQYDRLSMQGDGKIWALIGAPHNGSIATIDLHHPQHICIRKSHFLASSSGITISGTLPREHTALCDETGLACLALHGQGDVFLAAHGAVETVTLYPDDVLRVDLAHLLAWESGVTAAPVKAGMFRSAAAEFPWGDGKRLIDLTGTGRVWIQTRASF